MAIAPCDLMDEFGEKKIPVKDTTHIKYNLVGDHIDNYDFPEIIGTIAGDDTVMMVISENTTRAAVLRALRMIIPNI